VVIVHRSGPGFVATLFGALLIGATPCSIAPPFAFQRADDYRTRAGSLVHTARPTLVVTDDESLGRLGEITARLGLRPPVRFAELIAGRVVPAFAARPEPVGPDDVALLQFTSGSSAVGKGVRVSAAALHANVMAVISWLRWSPEEPGVSWLPVHHDMGLVGCLITPLAAGADLWLMQPEDFIRTPLRYLRCLSERRAKLTAMPGFALAHLIQRVNPRELGALDFSSLEAVIVGAERINPRLLESFYELLAPSGLPRSALRPAYGLAEATLCVTGVPLGETWTSSLPRAGDNGDHHETEVVGCGRPVNGIEVRVVGDDGTPVPDGTPGEIVVSGSSVTDGYVGDSVSPTGVAGQALSTGDSGFLRNGQLYVLGRLGDGLKMRGQMVFAESIEVALQERGIPPQRVAALLGFRGDVPVAAAVLDRPRDGWRDTAEDVLRAHAPGAQLLIISAPPGAISFTSSGKPRRRAMWQALAEGRLPGEVVTIGSAQQVTAGAAPDRRPMA
jgi:acyl-CoA synthetase (AMP-forming)/AMP-acid ligase II